MFTEDTDKIFNTLLVGFFGYITLYPIITSANWNNNLEMKSIKFLNVEEGYGSNRYSYISDEDGSNPEPAIVSNRSIKMENQKCYNVTLEGYRSFFQIRIIRSSESITCKAK